MNTETIGTNAGTVWTALNTAEALGIKQLKKMTKLKDKEVYAALGWLAREGKIEMAPNPLDSKHYILSLLSPQLAINKSRGAWPPWQRAASSLLEEGNWSQPTGCSAVTAEVSVPYRRGITRSTHSLPLMSVNGCGTMLRVAWVPSLNSTTALM